MASVNSLFKITGSLDELTFYRWKGQYVVRRKGGGFNSKAILTSPNHVRTRENSSEFGHCSRLGKAFRMGLTGMLMSNEFYKMSQRVQRLMLDLKQLDGVSERGKRTPALGVSTEGGKRLLKEFSFNNACLLHQLLLKPYTVTEGVFRIGNFQPQNDLKFPKGATQVGFTFGYYVFDFESGNGKLFASKKVLVGKDKNAFDLELVAPVYGGHGQVLSVLKIQFFQEVGGEYLVFKEKELGLVTVLDLKAL